MATHAIKIKKTPNPRAGGRIKPNHSRDLLPEPEFRTRLYWERQRSERSGNALILAMVNLSTANCGDKDQEMQIISKVLSPLVRATDSIGWHLEGKVLGVVFTDVREPSKLSVNGSINGRLTQSFPRATITYHVFPECSSGSVSPVFYPDPSARIGKTQRILKRCMDIAGSLFLLTALSPLLLLIAVGIKLTSKGPVYCKQTRIGSGGRSFTCYKFRSMVHNNDPSLHREYVTRLIAGQHVAQAGCSGSGIYKIVNDPRVTPVGKLLRRSSLDEFPQLFNVLKGEMSLVGPRPPLPYEFECYGTWHRRRVLEAKPGLTGLWQISGRCRTSFDDMVRLDLRYLQQWSIWLDLKILLKTPMAVVSGSGAY